MKHSALVYNPKSGSHAPRLLPPVLAALAAAGYDAEPRPTTAPGDATRLAREAAAQGVEAVFAMGGDGTLREAAAGLLGTEVALGPLPAGTANVLVRSLGLPRRTLAAARAMATARPRPIDVGRVGEELFLMMASCGLDSAVIARQSSFLKKIMGRAAFALRGVASWWSYGYPEIHVRHRAAGRGGKQLRGSLVVVANIPCYGGDFRIAPAADFGDQRLDLVVFRGGGRIATSGFARDLVLGRHTRRADVTTDRVEEVTIEAPDDVRLQIDGDVLVAPSPWTVRLAAERLRVLLPE